MVRGRDGAIDLLDCLSDPGAASVVECKFIGSEDAKEAPRRWTEVYKNLEKNLLKLNEYPNVTPNSPYQAWIDSERPIVRYRFCVTAMMSPGEIQALEARIATDLGQLVAKGVESLRHLAECEGAVRVFAWNWFEAELDEHPTLAFRWFRGLPVGVDLLTNRLGTESTFRDFLESGELRYFSRTEYVSETGESLYGEEADFAAALADGQPPALLISGPGGVGKTRLSLELAAALGSDAHNFDVYRLGRSASFQSLTELVGHYPTDRSILLLIDYAEAVTALAGVADAVAHLKANTKHRIRLIATCRSSANTLVRDSLAPLDPEERSLSSAQTGEADYVAWVTRSILSVELFPDPANLAQVCNGVPALAAFALFLFRHHREQFDLQFGVLHGLGDFEKWFNHRIEMLIGPLGKRRECERALAHIALALPIPAERYQMFSQQWGSLLDGLRVDRWIEYSDEAYHAVHDVFADALVSRWLFEAEHVATEHALELLDAAAGRLDLAHALTALERLAPHRRFVEIDGRHVVDVLLAKHPEQTVACCGLILGSKLLSLEAKLTVLHQSRALQEVIRRERSLDGVVSHLATEAVHRKLNLVDCPELRTVSDLLDHACNQPQYSNMVLRRAYALEPQRFCDRAFASIFEFAGAEQTHFLFVQMLRHGVAPSTIQSVVIHWLDCHSTTYRATFLYRAWLDAGGGTEAVAAPLLAWVDAHGQTDVAKFVYRAWLDAGGGTEAVAAPLLAWIDAHGQADVAQFVYCAWLDAGGGTEAVAAPLLAWVDAHGQTDVAQFIYRAWLDAGGGTEAVAAPLLAWVDAHGQTEDAQFVYRAWLVAGGGTEAVAAPLLAWIDAHGQADVAQFVYCAWLDAGGGTEAVAAPLLAWIDAHGQADVAQFVYCAWLDAGGGTEAVAAPLLAWVDAHGQTDVAQFIYRAWLEARGAFELVHDQVSGWVQAWANQPDFAYLSKILTKQHDLPEVIVSAIVGWCAAFPEHEDCLYRISALVSHLSEDSLSVAGRSTLLQCITTVTSSRDNLSILDRRLIWTLCQSLVSRSYNYNLDPIGTIRTVCGIVAQGTVFDRDLSDGGIFYLVENHGMQVMLVRQGLMLGTLHLERDQMGLARFAAWLRAYAPAFLQRLQAEFPNEIWGRLEP
ncbi:hypothetical protein NMD1_00831 [Novosphingobium sp. MD-1]|nr:hypothetical protein NMD1_00831 [Novosphingobium sp. MD-1]